MIKDLQYFLDEEERFCNLHPDYGQMTFDGPDGEVSYVGINDPLHYLSSKVFSYYYSKCKEPLVNEQKFGLSDAQRVLLRLLCWKHSYIFRDDYYVETTDFVNNLFDTLDDLVNKAPINNDSVLYRFCNDHDRCDMKVGGVLPIPYNLTCTNYDWHQEKYNNVYVIVPLKDGKSRAHNLYEIMGVKDENQVEFLRNTTFKVVKIDEVKGTVYKKFYLEEQTQ